MTGAPLKRNPKRQKVGIKENYSWVHPCFIIKEDKVTCKTTSKQIVVAIWATCRLCKFKSPDCKVYGVQTKLGNCPLWTRYIKHVENIHYLLNRKDLEETLVDPKVHWDIWRKARRGSARLRPGIKSKAHWMIVWKNLGTRVQKLKGALPTWRACVLLRIYLCTWAPAQGL